MSNKVRKEWFNEAKMYLKQYGLYEEDYDPFGTRSLFNRVELSAIASTVKEENLPEMMKILSYYGPNFKTAAELLEAWKAPGLLKFDPFVSSKPDGENLVIAHDKYLHWFRGYYFQISDTPDGDGDRGHGTDRLDFLLREVHDCITDRGMLKEAERTIYAGCFLETAFKHWKWALDILGKENNVFDEFLDKSGRRHIWQSVCTDDFLKHITMEVSEYKRTPEELFPSNNSEPGVDIAAVKLMYENTCYGLLVIDQESIRLVKCTAERRYEYYTFEVPNWVNALDEDGDMMLASREQFIKFFTRVLLRYAGWCVDYISFYPIGTKAKVALPVSFNVKSSVDSTYQLEDIIDELFA